MEILMRIERLHGLLARYTEIGFMEAVRAYQPAADYVKETEVKPWLKMMHIEEKRFKQMVKAGLIRSKRKGKAVNSPLYYSKKDIISALGTVEVESAVFDYVTSRDKGVLQEQSNRI